MIGTTAIFSRFGDPFGAWRSLVARLLWEQEVGGSNPLAPTNKNNKLEAFFGLFLLPIYMRGQIGGCFLTRWKIKTARWRFDSVPRRHENHFILNFMCFWALFICNQTSVSRKPLN